MDALVATYGKVYVIPTEDEWYKTAYYKGGGTDAGYWRYPTQAGYWGYPPTQSDTVPTPEPPPGADMTNGSANYYGVSYVDATYYTTECGAYDAKPSDSPYGTFDQGGNVWEWNEAIIGPDRGLRGGSFKSYDGYLHASGRYVFGSPALEDWGIGFRVSEVPEPATMAILALGGLAVLRRRRSC